MSTTHDPILTDLARYDRRTALMDDFDAEVERLIPSYTPDWDMIALDIDTAKLAELIHQNQYLHVHAMVERAYNTAAKDWAELEISQRAYEEPPEWQPRDIQ